MGFDPIKSTIRHVNINSSAFQILTGYLIELRLVRVVGGGGGGTHKLYGSQKKLALNFNNFTTGGAANLTLVFIYSLTILLNVFNNFEVLIN